MSEFDPETNPFPKIEVLPNPFKVVGRAVVSFFCLHQLSPTSDHFGKDPHPFDSELYDQAEHGEN